ncbi:hypothetical protein MVEN_00557300 [Mycena venus]|uniref:Uncharacterized protein n=1 Tax=Mycena venus TaxID=2733690 RepID=A0A8H6YJ69_9AGAR|nr:hypothetical protein MVEN_00557300 [Mycena venus]
MPFPGDEVQRGALVYALVITARASSDWFPIPHLVLARRQLNMGDFSSWLLLAGSLFIFTADCSGLPIPLVSEICATGACRTRRSAERLSGDAMHSEIFLPRSFHGSNTWVLAVTAGVVGGLAICGIAAMVFWYRRGNSAFSSTQEEIYIDWEDKAAPPSARYIAPLPQIYASGLASVRAAPSPKGPPNLVISVPTNEPPAFGRWKIKRVPVPSLSRLPSPSLTKIRAALRTPRRQGLSGPPPVTKAKAETEAETAPLRFLLRSSTPLAQTSRAAPLARCRQHH